MPEWADNSAFYLPSSHQAQLNESDRLQLQNIPALAASVHCDPVGHSHGSLLNFSVASYAISKVAAVRANVTIEMVDRYHEPRRCSTNSLLTSDFYPWPCSSQQTMAMEYMISLSGAGDSNGDPCHGLWLAVWARVPASRLCGNKSYTLSDDETTAMLCKPRVTVQSTNVTLTGEHRVLKAESNSVPEDFSDSDELINQASDALWRGNRFEINDLLFNGGKWHNDSFPSDWNSYVMRMMNPDAGFLDPTLPPPDFDLIADIFTRAYQKTFAIWLSLDHERLLAPSPTNDGSVISAIIHRPEVRIVVSRAMTILSSTILGLYIIVAVAVYARRPGKFLPRMPLTMASDIALFAASKAVGEMEAEDMLKHGLENEGRRFGYGSFIGLDGKPHVGVERVPFVIPAVR